ncbi:MAG: DUF4902 domain-containing protein [Rhodanobacter sp.]
MSSITPFAHSNTSTDGYVRIPESTLSLLTLRHLSSGLDDELLTDLQFAAVDALMAGYTEWQCCDWPCGSVNGISQVSVGWDWYLEGASRALLLAVGDVRSNVMAVDDQGLDVGMIRTARMLCCQLVRLEWPRIVAAAAPLPLHIYRSRLS